MPKKTIGELSKSFQEKLRLKRTGRKKAGRKSPYKKLNKKRKEIRLLLVKAGSHQHPLECELQQGFLAADPKPIYETISYVWGDAKRRTHVIVDGAWMDVPASAEAALRRMRLPDADRVLWI